MCIQMKFGINTRDKEILTNMQSFDMDSIKLALNPINRIKRGIEDGFRHFELSYDIDLFIPGLFDREKLKEMINLKEKYNLSFSVHLPFRSVELDYPHPYICDAFAKLLSEVILSVIPLQPEAFILHATGKLPEKISEIPASSAILKYLLEFTSRGIEKILDTSRIPPDKLAVETLTVHFDEMNEIINKLGLSVCMDTGHLLSGVSGDFTLKDFLDKYYDKIIEIHLHDGYNRFEMDGSHKSKAHLALGKGDMDLLDFVSDLKNRGYNGALVFEMGKYGDITASYNKIRELLSSLV